MDEIGLIDVDGHNFPNLALMRISAYHKSIGDNVEWWFGDMKHYDIVYKSKVFSAEYTQDVQDPLNADLVVKGGTGYCIKNDNGKELYDKAKDSKLPEELESMFPDYNIYPQYNFAVAMTSRGCPNNCDFCHVSKKEGRCSVKVGNLSDFWDFSKYQHREIKVLDPNITACKEKRELFKQYRDAEIPKIGKYSTKPMIDFTQGLDIRLLDDDDIDDINHMRIKNIHFAWDNPKQDLEIKFKSYREKAVHKPNGSFGTVYVLTNFNSNIEQDLYRVYALRDMNYDPYVMVYNKSNAPKDVKRLQRWCNNRKIFKSVKKFEEYID